MAVFSVSEVPDLTVTDLNIFFPVGIPKGNDLIAAGFVLEPKLVKISPNIGSVGGVLIEATIPGVGLSTTGIDLVNPSGLSICQLNTFKVIAYSKVQCVTNTEDMGAEALAISVKSGETTFPCAATDKTKCNYKQSSADSFPQVDSLTKTDTTIVFTGVNFYTLGYTAQAKFRGISADTVTLDSATQATATFNGGVPINSETEQSNANKPNLIFKMDNSETRYWAILAGAEIKNFVNPFVLSTSSNGVKCSFEGGCLFEMAGTAGVQTLF